MRARRGLLFVAATAVAASACSPPDLPAVAPLCNDVETVALLAQAVPTAEEVPCLDEYGDTVQVRTFDVDHTGATVVIAHATAGDEALTVTFARACRDAVGRELQPPATDGSSPDGFVEATGEGYRAREIDASPGGCVVTEYELETDRWEPVLDEVRDLVARVSRRTLAVRLRDLTGGRLDLDANTPTSP